MGVVEDVTLEGHPSDGEWTLDDAELGESRPFVLAQSKRSPKTYSAAANSTCQWSGRSSAEASKCGRRVERGGVFQIVK